MAKGKLNFQFTLQEKETTCYIRVDWQKSLDFQSSLRVKRKCCRVGMSNNKELEVQSALRRWRSCSVVVLVVVVVVVSITMRNWILQSTLREKTKCCIRVNWRKRSGFSILSLSRKEMLSSSRELDVQFALWEKKCGLLDVSNIATERIFNPLFR